MPRVLSSRVRSCLFVILPSLCALFVARNLSARPLEMECMDRYDIEEYIIGAWVWPQVSVEEDRERNREFWSRYRETGLNTINSTSSRAGMMRGIKGPILDKLPYEQDFIQKLGLKVMMDADHWAVWHLKDRHEKVGQHPTVLGYRMSDDNRDLYQHNVDVVWWLSEYAPHHIPWMSANPSPIPQSRCRMPVVSTQNYSWMYSAKDPEPRLRSGYCESLEADRLVANRYDMVSWVIMTAVSSPSQYRFQLNAPPAYGSQAVWLFTFQPMHPAALQEVLRETHDYLIEVAGPHLLGRRSMKVLHSGPEKPSATDSPAEGELITAMDDYLLAGLLVPDHKFQDGVMDVDRIYVVDKRTVKFDKLSELRAAVQAVSADGNPPYVPEEAQALNKRMHSEDPEPRAARVTLSPEIRKVTILMPDGSRKRCDLSESHTITLPPLKGGAGIMLVIDTEPVKRIVSPKSAELQIPPQKWALKMDFDEVADEEGWKDPDFDHSEWFVAQVPAYLGWTHQGLGLPFGTRLHGYGWYRLRWAIPKNMQKEHIYLHFGAVDEEAWVYIDGELVVANSEDATGMPLGRLWHIPFSAEVTEQLGDGEEHVIAVKVRNRGGAGGIYEPVYLMAADEPLDEDQLWRMADRQNHEWTWLWE